MKDFEGKELNKGEIVVMIAPKYRSLQKAIAFKSTPSGATLLYKHRHGCSLARVTRTSDCIVKIDSDLKIFYYVVPKQNYQEDLETIIDLKKEFPKHSVMGVITKQDKINVSLLENEQAFVLIGETPPGDDWKVLKL